MEDTLKPFGGLRIAAGGKVVRLEGQPPRGRIIIVQFPSLEQAHAWHESSAYQAILGYRLASSEGHAYFLEGVESAVPA